MPIAPHVPRSRSTTARLGAVLLLPLSACAATPPDAGPGDGHAASPQPAKPPQTPTPAASAEPTGPAGPPAGPDAAAAPPTPSAPAKPPARSWDFEDVATDTGLPPGFEVASGRWAVTGATGRRVLAQQARGREPDFNVILAPAHPALPADVAVTVRLRARAGTLDRGGGPVWRAQDGKNYYVARYNPLEDNFRVYKVVRGRRHQLGSAKVRIDHDAWHTVGVTMVGDRIRCTLDGKALLDVRDDALPAAGRVWLWTKADARTEFDDLSVRGVAP